MQTNHLMHLGPSCRALVFGLVLATGAMAGACASGDDDDAVLTVFAAASLTDAFTEVASEFEAATPGLEVKLNFAGSQSLRTQISHGARPHVFASANAQHMDELREEGMVAAPVVFAHNEMVIAVPANNPAGIESLADLPNARRIVIAGESVPAGAYALRVLDNANATLGADFSTRVASRVVSREMHVRQTLQKVVLGEADACLVYATDAAAAGDAVRIVRIDAALNVLADYPIAAVGSSKHGPAFVAFVRGDIGRRVLAKHGFQSAGEDAAVHGP